MIESASKTALVKRRQYLLLAGIGAVIILATVLSVSLTDSQHTDEHPPKPRSTNILSPGAQVDPRDAWRGQADAQLKSIEQKSRELSQRDTELQSQSRAMLERLSKLESNARDGLTSLPPPPVSAPAAPPNFGPDLPGNNPADNGLQRLPPPPLSAPRTNGIPAGSLGTPSTGGAPTGSLFGLVSIALNEPGVPAGHKGRGNATDPRTSPPHDLRRYLPSGSFTRALLLGGLDAPTGGQAQRNPQPVLLRLSDNAILPNQFRSRVKECFVVGAGYGDVSSERAYIRTESLSCVTRDGTAIDVPVKGYVAGEDGKAGMRGRLVSKQGQILANALLAGIASGIGSAFQQGATTMSLSPLGSTSTITSGKQFEAGFGTGVGRALDRLAQYYISLAEKVFPVIEVDAGRTVDVVLTQGVALQGPVDITSVDSETFPQLTERTNTLRRANDDDDE